MVMCELMSMSTFLLSNALYQSLLILAKMAEKQGLKASERCLRERERLFIGTGEKL